MLAVAAGWLLAGAPVPPLPAKRLRLPRVDGRALLLAAAAGAATGALSLGVTETPVIAASLALLGAAAPLGAAATRRRRAKAALADRWPDMLAVLRSQLASGAALPEAFVAAAHRTGGVFGDAGERVERSLAIGGRAFPAAIEELRTELADPVSDRVLTTIAEAHRAGGHRVAAILGALGASVADELRLRKAHDAALTQQRLTATVALVAPWVLLVLTVTTNPQAAGVYRTSSGMAVVAGGFVDTLAGYLLARRVARLSEPTRLFG